MRMRRGVTSPVTLRKRRRKKLTPKVLTKMKASAKCWTVTSQVTKTRTRTKTRTTRMMRMRQGRRKRRKAVAEPTLTMKRRARGRRRAAPIIPGQAPPRRTWRKWTRQRRERRWWPIFSTPMPRHLPRSQGWSSLATPPLGPCRAMVANLLDPNAEAPAKKSRLEQFGNAAPGAMQGNEAISEEAVRRYLKRRPMTTTDLLKKFRSKKTGIQNAQLVQLLANILKKINPHKHKVKGVTYLSLKEEK